MLRPRTGGPFHIKMQEQMPPQSAVSPTIGQYEDLFDFRHLAITRTSLEMMFDTLAFRLRQTLNVDVLTLGLCEPETECVRLHLWTANNATRGQGVPIHQCAAGWVWSSQRSLLIQDLTTEQKLPDCLESLRQMGVRSYYVFPLTTSQRKLGSVGFGSLHVIPKKKERIELLRRLAAMVAPLLEVPSCDIGAPIAFGRATESVGEEQQKGESEYEESQDEAVHEIMGDSAPLRKVLKQLKRVAPTDATVLLLGETGTGKELMARAIHQLSPRATKRFISVNCTAIPTELMESELFGHEKGAFTGAVSRRIGRLESANEGTLLLDEIGDLSGAIQPKLLRVLQDKEFERLGSNQTLKVNIRVIAATNQDLRQGMAEGRFREDLFYRLNVFPIYLPPLRERRSDIPALVRYFVSKYALESRKSITTIPAEAMDAFVDWNWRGNVRELQNLIQ
jgi:formate hydrogenlyase transcriptional activator